MKLCLVLCSLATCALSQVSPQALIAPDTVVARVDGKDVTAKEISEELRHMPPDFQKFFTQDPVYAVQQMYIMRYLAGLAENAKLGEDTPLKEQLAIARQNLLATAMLSYEQNSYVPPREAVQAYYDKNRANFQKAKVRAIKVAFNPSLGTPTPGLSVEDQARFALEAAMGKNQRTEAQARARAAEILEKLKAGATLESLAAEYSDDAASKSAGGAALIDHNSSYSVEIKKMVFALMPGELSQPLRLPDGFLVVKMEETSVEPLNNVALPIIQELRSAHLNEWYTNVNSRFAPQVRSPEFFRQASPAPAAPPTVGAPPVTR